VDIIIKKEFIQDKQRIIIKKSKKEEEFIIDLRNVTGNIDMSNISNIELLEKAAHKCISIIDSLWNKYSKFVNITKHSKL